MYNFLAKILEICLFPLYFATLFSPTFIIFQNLQDDIVITWFLLGSIWISTFFLMSVVNVILYYKNKHLKYNQLFREK